MARVSGSYQSIIRGVSQQVPAQRLDGQMGEQVNMISDPVAGLVRRRGMEYIVDQRMAVPEPPTRSMNSLRTYEFRQGEKDYTLIYSSANVSASTEVGYVQAYDKANRKLLSLALNPGDDNINNMIKWGLTSVTQVGNYLIMAANINKGTATREEQNRFPEKGSVWVRFGTYNRTYSVTLRANSASHTVSYKTPSSTYSGVLDTSDIPATIIQGTETTASSKTAVASGGGLATIAVDHAGNINGIGLTTDGGTVVFSQTSATIPGPEEYRFTGTYIVVAASYAGTVFNVTENYNIVIPNPNYAKLVNDRVNAYNAAVTAWIKSSAEQSTPLYIAQQLRDKILALGLVSPGNGQVGISGTAPSTVFIEIPGLTDLSCNDDANNDSMTATLNQVYDVSELPAFFWNNKIIEVRAKDSPDSFYMKATSDLGFGAVSWKETTSVVTTPAVVFAIGTIAEFEGVDRLFMAATPKQLRDMLPSAEDLPDFTGRLAGDEDTSPDPYFLTRSITYLDTFQDRLLVVSGNTASLSAVGDYFRFYAESVVVVNDNDPVELQVTGAETDTVRAGVRFDKSLVLFGESQQYILDGRNPVTPKSGALIPISAHEGTVDTSPILAGDLVFFARRRDGVVRLSQLTFGSVADSLRAEEITSPLKNYITGEPGQLLGVTSPNYLAVRTGGDRSSLYLYRYLDNQGERIFQAWFRFKYGPEFGNLVAMTTDEDKLILFFYQNSAGRSYISAYEQSLSVELSDYPYMDGLRPYTWMLQNYQQNTMMWDGYFYIACAVKPNTPYAYQGAPQAFDRNFDWQNSGYRLGLNSLWADFPDLDPADVVIGVPYESYVELTSPFRRDRNGVAITTGRFNVGRLDLSYTESAGLRADIITSVGRKTAVNYTGRDMRGFTTTTAIKLATGTLPVFVGRESRSYILAVYAQGWRPLTLTSIEYAGQSFGG